MFKNFNEINRQIWLTKAIGNLNSGSSILDAGAGELQNKKHCNHLKYTSQDICEYDGKGLSEGLQTGSWDISGIDIISDITSIPVSDLSFDNILCSEVFEHIPDPVLALKEFSRILKKEGKLVITAPFCSNVHFAPYHFSTGFSKYWYEYHLPKLGFKIIELSPNGDWFSLFEQELKRLGALEKKIGNWIWPISYLFIFLGLIYFKIRSKKTTNDLACFGYHCIAQKI